LRLLPACLVLAVLGAPGAAAPDDARVKELLRSDTYTVTWGPPMKIPADAALEVGDGSGHGGGLGWLRFRPGENGVEVLSIRFEAGRKPYGSKWPPDRAAVTVTRALLPAEVYAALLQDLAALAAANLTPVERNAIMGSSNDFWVHARLATDEATLLDLNWAGYQGSRTELEYAKPRAAVRLARDAVKALAFEEHDLTGVERAWASAKFARDWQRFEGLEFHWWVRERYVQAIGVVGDEAALPVLKHILAADPPKGAPRGASDARCVYYAINAVTRLTGKDVRDKPVEEMDIEKTRRRVLDLIGEGGK